MKPSLDPPESPCIGVCVLNVSQVCTGCGRRMEEIMAWPGATAERQHAILEAARRRKKEIKEGGNHD